MIFHDSTKHHFFSKYQNKDKFKNMYASEVFSSDFSEASESLQPQQVLNGLNDLSSLILLQKLLILMVGSFLVPIYSNQVG